MGSRIGHWTRVEGTNEPGHKVDCARTILGSSIV